jgi:hypothetical protein
MFLAEAGANIVSLDHHSAQQSGGVFMPRTICHLPGLIAMRDEPERDFAEKLAARFGMDFRMTEAASPAGSPPWRPMEITFRWCCWAVTVSWACRGKSDRPSCRPRRSMRQPGRACEMVALFAEAGWRRK